MRRKKEIVGFIFFIWAFCFLFLRLGGYFFTPLEVLYAQERGTKYGPSEEIKMVYEWESGEKIIIGKWGEHLSTVVAEPVLGILWKWGGGAGFLETKEDVEVEFGFGIGNKLIYGITKNADIQEVYSILEGDTNTNESEFIEVAMEVEKDGFFFQEIENKQLEDTSFHIVYTEGRGVNGEVLYKEGRNIIKEPLE